MGFFDKVKNMFTEEVEDDVKVEQVKKEVTHVSIESPKIDTFDLNDNLENISEEDEMNFSRPVFFDDNDFKDLNLNSEIETKKVIDDDLYNKKIEMPKEEKKVFKPTPIISPVYGILDKNYHKEDIVSRTEVKLQSDNTEPSIDSIRNKAYGTLEDELENTLFGTNSILFNQKDKNEEMSKELELEKIDDDTLTHLTDDISKELDELLSKKEKYLDKKTIKDDSVTDDLLDFIDSTLYKDGEDE